MGMISSVFGCGPPIPPIRVIITGTYGVGKTTLLYKLVFGKETVLYPIPTVGFNTETIKYKNVNLCVFDFRLGTKLDPMLRQMYPGTKGVIFVIDSSDYKYAEYAEHELRTLLQDDDLKNAPFLIYANKQDRTDAMSLDELTKLFKLYEWKNHRIHLQPACATECRGIHEGLDWLCAELNKNKQ